MNPKITIAGEGETEMIIRSALESIPELKVTKVGQDRGGLALGAAKTLKFVVEFVGGSAKVTDALVEQATKQLAGATLKVKLGSVEVEVTNATRSQVIELLDKAAEIAKAREDL